MAASERGGGFGWRREASGSNRVQRGGSWNNNARNCRSANRNNNNPSNRNNNNGLRLCCSAAPQDSENRAVPGAIRSVPPRGGAAKSEARPPLVRRMDVRGKAAGGPVLGARA